MPFTTQEGLQETAKIWAAACQGLTTEEILDGYDRIITEREVRWAPTPAEFRRYCKTLPGIRSIDDQANEQWAVVVKAIGRCGYTNSPVFEDHATAEAIRRIGGWISLCQSEEKDLKWLKKDFVSHYATAAQSGQTFGNKLVGYIDHHNETRLGIPHQEKNEMEIYSRPQPLNITMLEEPEKRLQLTDEQKSNAKSFFEELRERARGENPS
tara:strand:+ start:2815 stop:3447 length:633 start_codon:yes stop_codon:yes gene_type:complete